MLNMQPGSELKVYDDAQGIPMGTVTRDSKGRAWIWLKNVGSAAVAATKTVVPTTHSGFTVTLSTALAGAFGGVRAKGADSMAQNKWGWFQVRGLAYFTFGDTAQALTANDEHLVTDDDTDGGNVGKAANDAASVAGGFARNQSGAVSATDAEVIAAIYENCWGV